MSFAEKTARLARERSSGNVGRYQGEGVDPEVAAKLRALGIESGEPTTTSSTALPSPDSSRSPSTLRRRSASTSSDRRGGTREDVSHENTPPLPAREWKSPEAAKMAAKTVGARVAAQPRARAFGRAPAFPGATEARPGGGGAREALRMVPPGVEDLSLIHI